ncbi:SNF2-related protein [Corynebacterium diphtheriae]
MDPLRMSTLRSQGTYLREVAQRAQLLLNSLLEPHEPARFNTHGKISDVWVVPETAISWPPHLFTHEEFSEEHIEVTEILEKFIESTAGIVDLLHKTKIGVWSTLTRRVSSTANQQFEFAATELENLLANPELQLQLSRVIEYLRRYDRAESAYKSGVRHFLVENQDSPYGKAVRSSLASAMQLPEVCIDNLSKEYVRPAILLCEQLRAHPFSPWTLQRKALQAENKIIQCRALALLSSLSIDSLSQVTSERVSVTAIKRQGITSVAEIISRSVEDLEQIPGVGQQTAKRVKAAAQTLYSEALAQPLSTLGSEQSTELEALLNILYHYGRSREALSDELDRIDRLERYLQPVITHEKALWRSIPPAYFVIYSKGSDGHNTAYLQFIDDISWANIALSIPDLLSEGQGSVDIWKDYCERPAHYQSLWSAIRGNDQTPYSQSGLSSETLERIRAQKLNTSLLRDVFLRGYQSFGAKFVIVQRKVILGDEMGLGKTVQAIAAAAHVTAEKSSENPVKILIIVPASLMTNWAREWEKFCNIPVQIAHGENKQKAVAQWNDTAGALIVTYDGARTMQLLGATVVIVDEAHYIKNFEAKRSRAVSRIIAESEYALLLSGTPLENRIEEFCTLVSYLDSHCAISAPRLASAFKAHIAHLYLRRNQGDVLDELPEKIDHTEWVELSAEDEHLYRQAVHERNWMLMRRVAMLAARPDCAKMERLIDIVKEAESVGKNVIIFSYFRSVLERIEKDLGEYVAGSITGDVPPQRRQQLIDELGNTGRHVLLLQIVAGGVGLNIQKASVVIFTEAQVKFTLVDQAIARAHRMGQRDPVTVYRLFGADTVDERLTELLEHKRAVFDNYARDAEAAEVFDAVDVSEGELARNIIELEHDRLQIDN